LLSELESKFERIRALFGLNLHFIVIDCFKIHKKKEETLSEILTNKDNLIFIDCDSNINSDSDTNKDSFNYDTIYLVFFKPFEILISNVDSEAFLQLLRKEKTHNNKGNSSNSHNKKTTEKYLNSKSYLAQIFEYYEYLIPSSKFYDLKYSFSLMLQGQKNLLDNNKLYKNRQAAGYKKEIEVYPLYAPLEKLVLNVLQKTFDLINSKTNNENINANINNTTNTNEKNEKNYINDNFFSFIFLIIDQFEFFKIIFHNYFFLFISSAEDSAEINLNHYDYDNKFLLKLITRFIIHKFNIDKEIKTLLFSASASASAENDKQQQETNNENENAENFSINNDKLENEIIRAFGRNLSFSNNQHSIYFFLNFSDENIHKNTFVLHFQNAFVLFG